MHHKFIEVRPNHMTYYSPKEFIFVSFHYDVSFFLGFSHEPPYKRLRDFNRLILQIKQKF